MLPALYHRDNDISRPYLIFLVKSLDLCLSIQINFVFQELQIPLKERVCGSGTEGHLVHDSEAQTGKQHLIQSQMFSFAKRRHVMT